jgi:hypothetical protein
MFHHIHWTFKFQEYSVYVSSHTFGAAAFNGELKLMVVRLAFDTIHHSLFMVLVPGYLIELQNVLNHIWQSHVDANGKPVKLSAQVYYSNFLNAICSFYDLEEYHINLARIFQDHIVETLADPYKGRIPYPSVPNY